VGCLQVARILVVDDDQDIRDVLAVTLKRAGHVVVVAEDGARAAHLHHQQPFDLIVSDLIMPEMDGIALARAVRADCRSDIPILLVTASASPQRLADARRAGVTAHLKKPFRLVELRDQVAAMLAVA
jgi:two-component system chemotaxis response regulator CheY